ncbi:MAG: hypothetical protein ACP5VE_01135 [Chthonomonadales bacterium]
MDAAAKPLEPILLDDAAALNLAASMVCQAHTAELDARLAAIHRDFAAEQQAGYETLERNLRAWTQSHTRRDDIEAVVSLADRVRSAFRVLVVVGIGGSDLGARTLHDVLDHPFHNQLSPDQRRGAPELYFTGDTFDPKRLDALLELLEARRLLQHTCVNVVSKSGKTGETIAAALVIRERMIAAGIKDWASHFVATTGYAPDSVLFEMNRATPFFGILPVPEGVGGRFSFASPVGLFPYAVTAIREAPRDRVASALAGYAEAHRRFLLPADHRENGAFRLARWWHLAEQYSRKTDMVFCNYADDARLGDWFTQLYEESLQERGQGLNIIGTRGPTGNHSILNGILRGPHDKIVLFVRWSDLGSPLTIPTGSQIEGDLKFFEGLPMQAVQDASCRATMDDYLANGVPAAGITLARRDGYHLFLLMRTLMDAVAVKGRLQDLAVNDRGIPDAASDLTYRQDGVEGYKARTRANAQRMQAERSAQTAP